MVASLATFGLAFVPSLIGTIQYTGARRICIFTLMSPENACGPETRATALRSVSPPAPSHEGGSVKLALSLKLERFGAVFAVITFTSGEPGMSVVPRRPYRYTRAGSLPGPLLRTFARATVALSATSGSALLGVCTACVTSTGLAGRASVAPVDKSAREGASDTWIRSVKLAEKLAGMLSVKDGFTELTRRPMRAVPPAVAPISRRSTPISYTRWREQLMRNGKKLTNCSVPSPKKQPKPRPRLERVVGWRPVHWLAPR